MPSSTNIGGSDKFYVGRASGGNYNSGKIGLEWTPLYRYKATPIAGAPDDIAASQAVAAGGVAALTPAASGAALPAVPDVARNLVGAWTGTSTVTVVGKDILGNTQTEAQTGGAFTGKKTFSAVTSITSTAAVTALTFGVGDVLGLPFVTAVGDLLLTQFNGAIEVGTLTPPDATNPATATTGDPRGTYTPAGALNGVNVVSLLLALPWHNNNIDAFGVPGF